MKRANAHSHLESTSPSTDTRSVLLTPVTFPLTVGGTTFGMLVAFSATVGNVQGRLILTIGGLAYAAVTGITLYASGHVQRRTSHDLQLLLDRIAGILLPAIAVTLLATGWRTHR